MGVVCWRWLIPARAVSRARSVLMGVSADSGCERGWFWLRLYSDNSPFRCMCLADHHVVHGRCERMASFTNGPPAMVKKKKAPSMAADSPGSHHQMITELLPTTNQSSSRGRVVPPGHSCLDGESCSGGSYCRDQLCQCAEDEVVIQDKCVSNGEALQAIERITKSAPGQLCREGTECTGGSTCQGGICICPEESTLFRGECLSAKPTLSSINAHKSHALLFSPNAAEMDSSGEGRVQTDKGRSVWGI